MTSPRVLELVLDQIAHAVIALDYEARVIATNAAARRLLAARAPVFVERGRVACADPERRASFRAAIAAGLGTAGPARVLYLGRGERRWLAVVAPLGASFAALWLVGEPARLPHALLSTLFGMTRAEAQVMAGLAGGRSLAAIARERAVSSNTVRTHAKRSYAKLGVSGQLEAMRMLAPLLALDLNG